MCGTIYIYTFAYGKNVYFKILQFLQSMKNTEFYDLIEKSFSEHNFKS